MQQPLRASRELVVTTFLLNMAALQFLFPMTGTMRFDRISIEQGLSQNTVICMLQDRKGFIWIGTQDGLNKYDGYSFTTYKNDRFDPGSLSDNSIRSLCVDGSGILWIGTDGGGLNKFDQTTERFTHFVNDPDDSTSISDNHVLTICEDYHGTLWVGTLKGLNRFDTAKDQFTRFVSNPDDPTSLSHDMIRVVYEDQTGTPWVATNLGGLNRYDRLTGRFTQFRKEPHNPNSLSDDRIRSLIGDRSGFLWVGTWDGGLCRFDPRKERFTRFLNEGKNPHSLSNNTVMSVYEDDMGRVWIGTMGGISILDQHSAQFVHVRNNPTNPHSLSSDRVLSILEDRSGTLWFGTMGGGLNRYDRSQEQFTHIVSDPGSPNSLINNNVWAITKDRNGGVWIGTDGGLDKFDRGKNRFTHYVNDPNNGRSLSGNNVRSVYEDQSGTIWVATWGNGLNRFDRERNQFTRFLHDPEDPHSLSDNLVLRIYEDRRGTIWVGTIVGLDRFDHNTGAFTRVLPASRNSHVSRPMTVVSALCEDHTGMLWIGTEGLIRLDLKTGQERLFLNDPTDSTSLSLNRVFSVHEDPTGVLWIGTGGGGLDRFDRHSDRFTHYTERDGLANNTVYGILEDSTGRLWLSTNKGISRFDPRTETFKNFDVTDGIQSNEFNDGAFYKARDGEMFFGGVNGMTAFYPGNVKDDSGIPQLVITTFRIFDKIVKPQPDITEGGIVSLPFESNFFSFEFAALHYGNSRKNQYSYKMEGFDQDWIYCGTKREATYTNLDPGEYTFRVKGSNKDGIWNEVGTSARIVILPAYWQTWWFRATTLVAIAALVWSLHRYRVRQLVEVERVRTSIATELHDDIGSGLTRIAVLSDVMQKQLADLHPSTDGFSEQPIKPGSHDVKSVMRSATRIGSSARELHEAMSDVVWSINPSHDTLESFIRRARMFAVEVCEGRNIQLDFSVDPGAEKSSAHPTILRNLLLLTKEAVTNAVRHAQCHNMKITIGGSSAGLHLVIADDGKGFNPSADSTGNGLKNMRIRAQKLGATIALDSARGKGTRISLVVPRS